MFKSPRKVSNLSANFPNQKSPEWLSKIKSSALKRNWLRLYATSLTKEFDFQTALSEQFKVDKNEKHFEGIDIIVATAEPKQLIDYSVTNGDLRLLNICGDLCSKNSSLLNKLVVQNSNWRYIWLASVRTGNKIDDGVTKPKIKVSEVFDLVINNVEIEEELLEEIGLSDYANILDYKNRNEIWEKLPLTSRKNFLSKTATELLNKLSRNPSIEIPDDGTLEEYIINNGISK